MGARERCAADTIWTKVAVGEFIFVAIDDNGRTRAIPKSKGTGNGI